MGDIHQHHHGDIMHQPTYRGMHKKGSYIPLPITRGSTATLRLYLEKHKLNLHDLDPLVGFNLMVRACKMGARDWVDILLGKVPLNYLDGDGKSPRDDSPLLCACNWLNLPHGEHNLSLRTNKPIPKEDFETKFDIVRLLLKHGADVNGCDTFFDSAIVEAANCDCYNIVKLLLRAGVDVPAKKYFASHHRFDIVDPRTSMLIDEVYKAVTISTEKKRKASLIVMSRQQVPGDLMRDILQRRVPRSGTLDVDLEQIISSVELACAGHLENVPYRA
jgi:hypothetical protein